MVEYKVEYKHQQVGMPFPVYCTDRDASALRMFMFGRKRYEQYRMVFFSTPYLVKYSWNPPRFATDPAELRWMADIAAGDDVWGS